MNKMENEELDLLYTEKKSKNKKKTGKTVKNKKVNKNNSKRADSNSAQKSHDTFNFDNEIVIGVTKTTKDKGQAKKGKSSQSKKSKKKKNISNQTKKKNNTNRKETKNKTITKEIIKWIILLTALAASFIFFMMSPLFNIAEIEVTGNEKISTDTIISLSNIEIGENLYKTSNKKVKTNIKENAYIKDVNIKRIWPNKVLINVKERKTTYMLEYGSSYAYINNQGYILEISKEKLEIPIIIGYQTKQEDIIVGGRLCSEDLNRLEVVLQIVESANGNGIGNLITKVNIEDKQNYTLIMEQEKKTVYLGDASSLSSRMLYLKAILVDDQGIEGEIFINGDLNKEKAFFRKKE